MENIDISTTDSLVSEVVARDPAYFSMFPHGRYWDALRSDLAVLPAAIKSMRRGRLARLLPGARFPSNSAAPLGHLAMVERRLAAESA